MGAHGWFAEIISHGSIILSGDMRGGGEGALVTEEAPGYPLNQLPYSMMQLYTYERSVLKTACINFNKIYLVRHQGSYRTANFIVGLFV